MIVNLFTVKQFCYIFFRTGLFIKAGGYFLEMFIYALARSFEHALFIPGQSTPSIMAPESLVPGLSTPSIVAPESLVPGLSAPSIVAPERVVPEEIEYSRVGHMLK